jgi:hypothetical protein
LKYKGHLSNISENTLMTAVNDEGGNINVARDVDGSEDTIPRTMQKYQQRGEGWMLVVDDNCMFFLLFCFPSSSSLSSLRIRLVVITALHVLGSEADLQMERDPLVNTRLYNLGFTDVN